MAGQRVLFIQEHALDESLALADLSAALKAAGHTTGLLLRREEPDLIGAARRFAPDLVLLPTGLSMHARSYALAGEVKRGLGVPVALGGPHPTFFPQHVLAQREVDFALLGEAEAPTLALLGAMAEGKAPDAAGVGHRRGGEVVLPPLAAGPDLTAMPLPDRDLYWRAYPFMARFPVKKFNTSRGCIHRCSYCYQPLLQDKQPGPAVRRRTVDSVLAELDLARARGPLSHVHFSDDLFTVLPEWLEVFAPRYRREVGVPFTCNSSPELLTPRAARLLREAGCWGVGVGLETGVEALRTTTLQRSSDAALRGAVAAAQREGLKVLTFNVIGVPGEAPTDVWRTAALNRELGVDYQRATLCFPVPGTALMRRGVEMGVVPPELEHNIDAASPLAWRQGPPWLPPAEREERVKLYHLFRLMVRRPGLARRLEVLTRRAPARVLTPLMVLGLWDEMRFGRVPVVAGLRFMRHSGGTDGRSTLFPSML